MKLLPIYDIRNNKIYAIEFNLNASIFDVYDTVIHLSNTKKKNIKLETRVALTEKALEFQLKMHGIKYNYKELVFLEDVLFEEYK